MSNDFEVCWLEVERRDGRRVEVHKNRTFEVLPDADAFYNTRKYAGDIDGLVLRRWEGSRFKVVREYAFEQPVQPSREHLASMRRQINAAVQNYNQPPEEDE